MFKTILVPVDLAETQLAKSAIATACSMASASGGTVRLLNVMPMTPVMLAEYVPPDFEAQQKTASEEALAIIAGECGMEPGRVRSGLGSRRARRRGHAAPNAGSRGRAATSSAGTHATSRLSASVDFPTTLSQSSSGVTGVPPTNGS